MPSRKPRKRGKARSGAASAGSKKSEVAHTAPESVLVKQATRDFLEQDEKLAEASKRRVEAIRKRGAQKPPRKA